MTFHRDDIQYLAASALTHLHGAQKDYARYKEKVIELSKGDKEIQDKMLCGNGDVEEALDACSKKLETVLENFYIGNGL